MSDKNKTDAIKCSYLPSSLSDDYHQKTYTAGKVAKMMEKGHENSRKLAVDLRRIIDLI